MVEMSNCVEVKYNFLNCSANFRLVDCLCRVNKMGAKEGF